jgi:predicted transcriptional regulator
MAIPWLTALKIIPWGDVIEHAPKVLNKARDLMERKRADATASDVTVADAGDDVPSMGELKNRLLAAHMQIDQLQQTQTQLTQTVAELAEQNAALVSAVSGLRRSIRLAVLGLVMAFLGLGGVAYSQFF